jgi:hypothetical protein
LPGLRAPAALIDKNAWCASIDCQVGPSTWTGQACSSSIDEIAQHCKGVGQELRRFFDLAQKTGRVSTRSEHAV